MLVGILAFVSFNAASNTNLDLIATPYIEARAETQPTVTIYGQRQTEAQKLNYLDYAARVQAGSSRSIPSGGSRADRPNAASDQNSDKD